MKAVGPLGVSSHSAWLMLIADSIYGFCGAVAGFLPCIPIAATVTAIGRNTLDLLLCLSTCAGVCACQLVRYLILSRLLAFLHMALLLAPRTVKCNARLFIVHCVSLVIVVQATSSRGRRKL